jgi:membrane protease YdiL (CAAX protease family)
MVDALPVLVPGSMTMVFGLLRARMAPQRAYNVGFGVYWAGWCFALPLLVLGPERTWRLLVGGRRATASERVLMAVPVIGGVTTAFWPNRRRVDLPVASVMIGTAVVNAVGEELLWRGLPLAVHGDEPWQGCAWPLVGFAGWHLAPQLILVSERGRWRFVAGAAAVGLGSAVTAWRARGLRSTLLPHVLTDACGVGAAEFRLGRLPSSR